MSRTTAFVLLALCVITGAALAGDLVVHAGTLIDGAGAAPQPKMSILVHEDRITAVVPGFVTPPGATVVDLSTATVLPGFIDCHYTSASACRAART